MSHMQDGLGLHPLMYTVPWFLCLFTFLPCWETVLLICDLLLLEGQHCIHRMAVCILCRVYDFMCDVCTYHDVYDTCSTLNITRFMVAAV